MKKNRLDANESSFFAKALEYVKAKTYDVIYKDLKSYQYIPATDEAPSGSETIKYRSYGSLGVAKIVSDYATDFPRVDTYGEEKSVKVYSLGDSYGYDVMEIRRAASAGSNLETRKANAARRAIEALRDRIVWLGDADTEISGVLNHPEISEASNPNGAAGFSTIASKTPDEIVATFKALFQAIDTPTLGKESPNTCLMPGHVLLDISTRRMTDGNSKTVLEYLKMAFPGITVWDSLGELIGIGSGQNSNDRMIMLSADPQKIEVQDPQIFETFEPEKEGLTYTIICHAETAGAIVYYPLAHAYMDGV